MTPILLTKDATLDDLSAGDYRDMYDELRGKMSLDKLVDLLHSQYSKAQWHKYEHGGMTLTRTMRNELRAALRLPLLPPTVAEVTAQASPDAAVWSVGEGVPEHVILVSGAPVTLHVNGSVQASAYNAALPRLHGPTRHRTRYVRPCIPDRYAERLQALGCVSWLDVIETGLQELEAWRAKGGEL